MMGPRALRLEGPEPRGPHGVSAYAASTVAADSTALLLKPCMPRLPLLNVADANVTCDAIPRLIDPGSWFGTEIAPCGKLLSLFFSFLNNSSGTYTIRSGVLWCYEG